MTLDVALARAYEKDVVAQLLQLYLYDLAEYANEGWRDVGPDGRFSYRYLDDYWRESQRHPFLVRLDGQLVGFVLVNDHTVLTQPPGTKSIAEFFIMRKYRRRGVGAAVARAVFDMFPGSWEVAQDAPNTPAQQFWRTVIDDYTGGNFSTTIVDDERWRGPVLSFTTPARS